MLIVAGTIVVDPKDVETLRGAAATMMVETLQETGCHQYVFSQNLTDPGSVQIFEMWQSIEELETHFQTPHMASFLKVLSTIDVRSRELHRYEVAGIEKM